MNKPPNYKLSETNTSKKTSTLRLARQFLPYIQGEKLTVIVALVALLINSASGLIVPYIIARTIDTAIAHRDFPAVITAAVISFVIYLAGMVAFYYQTKLMGSVGQRLLFHLRNAIFVKLQTLPVAFFNQNKAGDLISRINNDTDKLNQFFSQALMQFIGGLFLMIGAGATMLALNIRLGVVALLPALGMVVFTQVISGWVKAKNSLNLKALGNMSAEIQESLDNFKVIVAFDRRDYFKDRFNEVNAKNYQAAVIAGLANNVFMPMNSFVSNIAYMAVLLVGIYLISRGEFSVGLLIGYLAYLMRFYDPMRQISSLWSSFQVALAGWDRIIEILSLESNLIHLPNGTKKQTDGMLEFQSVSFHYPDGKEVLKNISFSLESGKTYALVGPTGGGKTTTASLMARLYDPTSGTVLLNGRDIRSYNDEERTNRIGFILQEPILFSGTIKENILYGNTECQHLSTEALETLLKQKGLDRLLTRFSNGLTTKVGSKGETISLGQKQLIAFIRAALRDPEVLILDEATANIDTVTEQLLDEILTKLPKKTVKVIIAHRLNTIEHADEIFFVNDGEMTKAGSLKHAMALLLNGKRAS